MTEAEAKTILQRDGYSNIYTWFDSPEEEYEAHAHPEERSYIIIQGEMTVTMNDETKIYHPAERCTIPHTIEHTALMGPEGCMYVVGEK